MSTATPDAKLRELEEENELLISQLHLVQEELERYYLRNKELEAAGTTSAPSTTSVQLREWVDDELPVALAENERLKTLLDMQQQVRQLEAEYSLPARLYAALSVVATQGGKIIRVPKRLHSFWSKESEKNAPTLLGGKGHPKVVAAYQEKGIEQVAQLLSNNNLSVTQVANAWTDLARYLQEQKKHQDSAHAARQAYQADPKPFRLKWLAFRLYKAGELQQAEAALDLLPEGFALSDSEQTSADKIRQKADSERQKQAKQNSRFNARRAEAEKQLKGLSAERNKLQIDVRQAREESRSLKAEQEQLREKVSKLTRTRQDLDYRLQQNDSSLLQMQTELELVRVELNNKIENYSLLQSEKLELENQVAESEQNISDLNSSLNKATDALKVLKAEVVQGKAEKEELEKELDKASQNLLKETEESKKLEEKYKELEWKYKNLEQENNKKEDQFSLHSKKFQELQQEILESRSRSESLEHQQQLMKGEIIRSESQLDIIKELFLLRQGWVEQQQQALASTQPQAVSKSDLDAMFKKQSEEAVKVRNYLDSSLKREVANAAKQVQAFVGLQSYLATGELPSLNIESHKWPISSDFAFYLAELLEENSYHLIVELGSGKSTTLMARILKKMVDRADSGKKPSTALVSFDHHERYYQQTRRSLQQAGLCSFVQLHHAPLVDWQGPDGTVQPYYDCQEVLSQLGTQYPDRNQLRMLVVIDGPPGDTGKHARYPACPIVLQNFKGAQIDFLMDDYIREDEKEVAQRWKYEITANHLSYTFLERLLEKQSCLLRVNSL